MEVVVKGVASRAEVVKEESLLCAALRAGLGGWFHSWERPGSLQTPKLVLVMEPTIDLSTSQLRPRSQGHL